jgi:predicted RND superfamily exporter protein
VLKNLVDRLSRLQIRHPSVPLALVAAVTVLLGYFATRLELRTRYDQLLPDDQPSVTELHRVEARTANAQTVDLVLEGPNRADLRAMGDALIPALVALGPDVISTAEDGTQQARRFLMPRAGLFLDQKELERLRDDVFARWDYEVEKEQDQLLDDTGPPVTIEDIEKRLRRQKDSGAAGKATKAEEDHSDGYYERKDGTGLVVIARSPIPGGDLRRVGAALQRIRAAVEQVRTSRPEFAPIHVGYAGDMPTGFIEYDSIRNDLLSVGAFGIAMVLAAVLLYFMRIRALFVMGVTIAVALVWTLGVTQLCIGYLNVATGFLISIVAGNGINVGILYQARYFEERRKGVPVADALRAAVTATWQPTAVAALSAAASYISLMVTEFSAFRQFGFIAASGMLLCWVVKTLAVPPLLLLSERWKPLNQDGDEKPGLLARVRRFGLGYGRFFAWLVPKAPTAIMGLAALVVLGGAVAAVCYVRSDPREYDLQATENDHQQDPELHRAWTGVIDILGEGRDGMVILTDTAEEGKELQHKLQGDWDAAPADAKPFAAVHSLWDLVPDGQTEKIPVLEEVREKLQRARDRHFLSDDDWEKIEAYLPPDHLEPFRIADLPEPIARPFTEKDGRRGTIVVVEAESHKSNDLHYLLKYSDSFRETRLASGKIVRGSGRAVIFSDILKAVVHDIPRAVALSLALTLAAVVITFRRGGWHALSVIFALVVGVAGEALFLYFRGVKINFVNFAALPITFGIGVDYAVNVVQRYRADGGRDILAALRTTGGAVVLCSLTTTVGYLALLESENRGIRSLGLIAVVGEATCLLTAVTVLPALWLLIERRRTAPRRTPAAVDRHEKSVP